MSHKTVLLLQQIG